MMLEEAWALFEPDVVLAAPQCTMWSRAANRKEPEAKEKARLGERSTLTWLAQWMTWQGQVDRLYLVENPVGSSIFHTLTFGKHVWRHEQQDEDHRSVCFWSNTPGDTRAGEEAYGLADQPAFEETTSAVHLHRSTWTASGDSSRRTGRDGPSRGLPEGLGTGYRRRYCARPVKTRIVCWMGLPPVQRTQHRTTQQDSRAVSLPKQHDSFNGRTASTDRNSPDGKIASTASTREQTTHTTTKFERTIRRRRSIATKDCGTEGDDRHRVED